MRKLDELLAVRRAQYPTRGPIIQEIEQVVETMAREFLDEAAPCSDAELAAWARLADDMTAAPIFVCGSMKSGTSLMTQLLDDHPALLVMPGDSRYLDTEAKSNRDDHVAIVAHWLQRLINPSGKEPHWFLGRELDAYRQFARALRGLLQRSSRDVFVCVVTAVHLSNPRVAADAAIRWVEKTPGNEHRVFDLSRKYPRAQFIHMVRDPLENIASLKRLYGFRDWPFAARGIAGTLRQSLARARENRAALGPDRYIRLRYEQLVGAPEATMRGLADSLGIAYCESLVTPTENGRPSQANSMYPEARVRGEILSRTHEKRYLRELTRNEIIDVLQALGPEIPAQGYAYDVDALLREASPSPAPARGDVLELLRQARRRWYLLRRPSASATIPPSATAGRVD